MSLEPAFLAAIAAAPDDDLPRLVYADWLDENGRHIRAEFIRLQIEIANKETLPRAALNLFTHLWKRQQEILDDHREELLGPLAEVCDYHSTFFRRGFLEWVELYLHDFLRLQDTLHALLPQPDVCVWEAIFPIENLTAPDLITELHVERIRLDDRDDPFAESSAFGALTVHGRLFTRVKVLDLENCRFGDALRMTFRLGFPALEDLDLSFNEITDAGVVALLGTGVPQRLKRLVLGGNPIGDEGAIALADALANSPALENLNLRMTNIGTAGRAALLAALGSKVDLF